MKQIAGSAVIIGILVVFIVALNALFIVSETEQVVITQFGEPVGHSIQKPGLYFKIPFIQEVHSYDDRLLTWDGDPNQITTKDKRYIWIDTTARWKIVDPLKFMQTVYTYERAHQQLDAIVDGTTRNVIADKNLIEIVRSSNRILDLPLVDDQSDESHSMADFEKIPDNSGREAMQKHILEQSKPKFGVYGIELIDVRIKRLNYERNVGMKVFERMKSERKRVAEKYRSEGEAERARVEGMIEKEVNRIQSEAYEKAQKIRGAADATAIKIYADAYSKDPEFFSFLMTLDSYKQTLKDHTMLVLATDNDYLSYLKDIAGGMKGNGENSAGTN